MSRHRIVRTMDYNDEYDGYDDVYGHSVDDDSCISPSDASQWIYDRARGQQSMSAFMAANENIEEEDEDTVNGEGEYMKKRRDSENFQMPVLDDISQAKLISCMEEIRSVVGDSVSDRQIVEAVMNFDYDVAKALDHILNSPADSSRAKQGVVAAKDSTDKDFKPKLVISNSKFKIPKLNPSQSISTLSSTDSSNKKIDELIKRNFQSANASSLPTKLTFTIPQLKPSQSKGSDCPKMGQLVQQNTMSEPSAQPTSNFSIPKLSCFFKSDTASSPIGSMSNHDMLLQKIMDSKKLKTIQDLNAKFEQKLTMNDKITNNTQLIGLTQALTINSSDVCDRKTLQSRDETDKSLLPMKLCNRIPPPKRLDTNQQCQMDISGVLREKLSEIRAKPTNFGKIMTLKYRCRSLPYVSHTFSPKHQLVRFKFETRSPDDIILSHLNKKKI